MRRLEWAVQARTCISPAMTRPGVHLGKRERRRLLFQGQAVAGAMRAVAASIAASASSIAKSADAQIERNGIMVFAGKEDADDVKAKEFFALKRKFHLQKARAEVEALHRSLQLLVLRGLVESLRTTTSITTTARAATPTTTSRTTTTTRTLSVLSKSASFTLLFSSSVPIPNTCDEILHQRRVGVSACELSAPRCDSVVPSLKVLGGGAELDRGTCSAVRTNIVLRIVMSTITVVLLVSSLPPYFYTMTSHRDIYIYNC
jgi:hypothetical protein